MSNVVLSKAGGLVCSLPVDTIVAILSTALDADYGASPVRSVALSTLRGGTCPGLAHTAAEAADEVEKAGGSHVWIVLSCGEDFTRIRSDRVKGFDEVSAERIVAFYQRPDDEIGGAPINNTRENLSLLKAALEGDSE